MKTILIIPGRVHGLNGKEGLIRMHYHRRAELKDRWIWLFRQQAKGNRHTGKVKVVISRYALKVFEDFDNLAGSMKIPMDAAKEAGIITDDKMRIIGHPTFYQYRVADATQERYVIEIEDLESE